MDGSSLRRGAFPAGEEQVPGPDQRGRERVEWLDQLPTQGPLTQLPSDKLAEVLEAVGAAIDATGGSFTMPYTTVVVTAARTGAA